MPTRASLNGSIEEPKRVPSPRSSTQGTAALTQPETTRTPLHFQSQYLAPQPAVARITKSVRRCARTAADVLSSPAREAGDGATDPDIRMDSWELVISWASSGVARSATWFFTW
jgi:hypothetical protein